MNYTTNYHLPQWVKEDRIMMDDFNAAMANLEEGLSRAVSSAAADTSSAAAKVAADAAAAAAKIEAAAAAAQAAADRAIAAAAAAQATADAAYSPSQQPYVVGTYMGTAAEITVTLGFQPKFLIISSPTTKYVHMHIMPIGGGIQSVQVEITTKGFKVYPNAAEGSSEAPPLVNSLRTQYVYIAFR